MYTTFLMKLSSFDCSHKSEVPGTPEVLIPHAAMSFFPPISDNGRKYEDVYFNVLLNTPAGNNIYSYRLWYYDVRATGKPIDENRLRMNHETINLTTDGGGDLLVISKISDSDNPAYEVCIVNQDSPDYSRLASLCTRISNDKEWGLI